MTDSEIEQRREKRREWAARPENRQRRRERERAKFANDPEHRQRRRLALRKLLDDPAYKEKRRLRERERYSDPAVRAKVLTAMREKRLDPEARRRLAEKRRTWERSNRETINEQRRRRYSENPEQVCVRAREKRKNDVNIRLAHVLRNRLRSVLRQRGSAVKVGSAVRDLGCSVEDLRLHLERQWQPGMTWENYGRGRGKWNIDHSRPLAAFDLTNQQQWNEACHYSNLVPMWSIENHAKCDRLPDGTVGRDIRGQLLSA